MRKRIKKPYIAAVFVVFLLCFMVKNVNATGTVMYNDTFESGIGTWNDTGSIINGGGIADNLYLSYNHSLKLIYLDSVNNDKGILNISFIDSSSDDFFVSFSVYINDTYDTGYDMLQLAEKDFSSMFGLFIDIDSGNWSFYDDKDTKITPFKPFNNTWNNVTLEFINAFSTNYTLQMVFTNNSVNGNNIQYGTRSLFNGISPNDIIMQIISVDTNTYYYDNVCIWNGTIPNDGYIADECIYWASPPGPCVQNWTCGAWGECVRGYQTRECVDDNECQNETGKPTETQLCLKGLPNASFNVSTAGCCPISTIYCTNNETLLQVWNTSEGLSWASQNCPYGCDNATSMCVPVPYQQNLYLLVIFAAIVVIGLAFIRWVR